MDMQDKMVESMDQKSSAGFASAEGHDAKDPSCDSRDKGGDARPFRSSPAWTMAKLVLFLVGAITVWYAGILAMAYDALYDVLMHAAKAAYEMWSHVAAPLGL